MAGQATATAVAGQAISQDEASKGPQQVAMNPATAALFLNGGNSTSALAASATSAAQNGVNLNGISAATSGANAQDLSA